MSDDLTELLSNRQFYIIVQSFHSDLRFCCSIFSILCIKESIFRDTTLTHQPQQPQRVEQRQCWQTRAVMMHEGNIHRWNVEKGEVTTLQKTWLWKANTPLDVRSNTHTLLNPAIKTIVKHQNLDPPQTYVTWAGDQLRDPPSCLKLEPIVS